MTLKSPGMAIPGLRWDGCAWALVGGFSRARGGSRCFWECGRVPVVSCSVDWMEDPHPPPEPAPG